MKVQWVPLEVVLSVHRYQLHKFGGSTGIRDLGLLESALARPMHLHHYDPKASIFKLAAAYGYGIAKNHPFVDGNKRAALVTMGIFLEINGYRFVAPQVETLLKILALAAGDLSEEALAEWLKTATTKAKP